MMSSAAAIILIIFICDKKRPRKWKSKRETGKSRAFNLLA